MNDPITREIHARLTILSSEDRVNELVDICNSVHSTNLSESVASLVHKVSRIIHPSNSLYLLKFISAFSKKDSKFAKAVLDDLADTVLFCYQACSESEQVTIRLYVSGWKMRVSPWPDIARKSEAIMALRDCKHSLHGLETDVNAPPEMRELLSSIAQNGDKSQPETLISMSKHASDRLAVLVSSINRIRSIVSR